MTALDVVFRYETPPGPAQLRALDSLREVYGIRRILFNKQDKTVRVEYDASRLTENIVAAMLRRATLDIREKLALA